MKRLFFIALIVLWAAQAYAGLFVWTDDRGAKHYTDDEKKIPEKYRDKATEPSLKDPIVQSNYKADVSTGMDVEEGPTEYGGKPVFYWVQQINRMETDLIEARNTVILLENELDSLQYLKIGQVRRNPIVGKFYSRPIGSESSLYFVDENEKELLEMKLEQVKQQAESIKKEIEIFRDDAKKASVPPKYL
jgi:hypothetical protein